MAVERKVYVLYTGGTFGMKPDEEGRLVPQPLEVIKDFLIDHTVLYERKPGEPYEQARARVVTAEGIITLYHQLADDDPHAKGQKYMVTYKMDSLDHPLDSSSVTPKDWNTMANKIWENKGYDAFVIIHGTDTMAYTSSALSFMLKNLQKTVIVTGAQMPIFHPRTDGLDNFTGSMLMAGYFCDRDLLKTVMLYNLNKLYKGNRVVKADCDSFSVFDSPDDFPIASLENIIKLYEHELLDDRVPLLDEMPALRPLEAKDVRILRFFPGIDQCYVESVLTGAHAVILETYGSGNVPENDWLPDLLQEADKNKVLMLNCTQVYRGTVLPIYEASKALTDAHVIPGYDITPEAALTKMTWVLNFTPDVEKQRKIMASSVCGESCAPPYPI